MVKDHSDSERGNPLPPHGLLFPINSNIFFRRRQCDCLTFWSVPWPCVFRPLSWWPLLPTPWPYRPCPPRRILATGYSGGRCPPTCGQQERTACCKTWGERERNVLFNDALNTFYLRLYGVRHMVKDHSDSEKGNPLPPHRLLLSINSKGSFICTIPQTG